MMTLFDDEQVLEAYAEDIKNSEARETAERMIRKGKMSPEARFTHNSMRYPVIHIPTRPTTTGSRLHIYPILFYQVQRNLFHFGE